MLLLAMAVAGEKAALGAKAEAIVAPKTATRARAYFIMTVPFRRRL
jgi:hypothetical protein